MFTEIQDSKLEKLYSTPQDGNEPSWCLMRTAYQLLVIQTRRNEWYLQHKSFMKPSLMDRLLTMAMNAWPATSQTALPNNPQEE